MKTLNNIEILPLNIQINYEKDLDLFDDKDILDDPEDEKLIPSKKIIDEIEVEICIELYILIFLK